MKTYLRFFCPALLCCVLSLFSWAQSAELQAFNAIRVQGGVNVTFRPSEQFRITGDVVNPETAYVEVKNNCLIIKRKGNKKTPVPIIVIEGKAISSVLASRGAKVTLDSLTSSDTLVIQTHSGSEVRATVYNSVVRARGRSGSFILLTGKTGELEGNVRQGSRIRANQLTFNNARVAIASGSFVALTASPNISGGVTSGGELKIYGNTTPDQVQQKSGGKITLTSE